MEQDKVGQEDEDEEEEKETEEGVEEEEEQEELSRVLICPQQQFQLVTQ